MKRSIASFNSEIDNIEKNLLGGRCSPKELKKYHLLPTEAPFNGELANVAQVMLRLGNAAMVRAVREQEARVIDTTRASNANTAKMRSPWFWMKGTYISNVLAVEWLWRRSGRRYLVQRVHRS